MPHSALKLMPGVDVNKTPALNEAAISESQLIRFIPDRTLGGLVQKLGGWTRFYAAQIGSTVRALWAWEDTNANSYLAVGADGTAPIVVTGASGTGTTATLTLTNLQTRDLGNYFCVVSNVYGSVTSAVASLVMMNPASTDDFNPGANNSVWALASQPCHRCVPGRRAQRDSPGA